MPPIYHWSPVRKTEAAPVDAFELWLGDGLRRLYQNMVAEAVPLQLLKLLGEGAGPGRLRTAPWGRRKYCGPNTRRCIETRTSACVQLLSRYEGCVEGRAAEHRAGASQFEQERDAYERRTGAARLEA
jgi:hypothetical protein